MWLLKGLGSTWDKYVYVHSIYMCVCVCLFVCVCVCACVRVCVCVCLTGHAVALHAAHLVLRLQRGQQRGSYGDAVQHGAELQHDGLLLQPLGQLGELVG